MAYTVIDLGRDAAAAGHRRCRRSNANAPLVGLSALMTTTLPAMERTIDAAARAGARTPRIMVGGAVLTEDYAQRIGADHYCR